jgi:hypothetical protein
MNGEQVAKWAPVVIRELVDFVMWIKERRAKRKAAKRKAPPC